MDWTLKEPTLQESCGLIVEEYFADPTLSGLYADSRDSEVVQA
jgi:hypothetical protein